MMRPSHSTLIALFLLTGCRATTPAPVTAPAAEATTAVGKVTPDVHWANKSAEYRANLIQVYHWAEERLEELIVDRQPGTWAVALDADETVISNIEFEIELRQANDNYEEADFGAWTASRAATPLPGSLGFLARVRDLGGKIAIVTNRREENCPDTEANFREQSIPHDVILCRGDDREKEPRWEKVRNGTGSPDLPPLDIVMWLGDNIQDFPGLDQDLRFEDEDAHHRFGVDFFIMPNPMYGSWEDNPD